MSTPILFLALGQAITIIVLLYNVVWSRAAVRDLQDDFEFALTAIKDGAAGRNELRAGICAAKNTDVLHGAQLRGAGERIRTLEADVAALNKTVETMIQGSNQ